MIGQDGRHDDLDPVLHDLLTLTYDEQLDVDVAAGHLWRLHRLAVRRRVRGLPLRLTSVAAMAFALLLVLSGTVSTARHGLGPDTVDAVALLTGETAPATQPGAGAPGSKIRARAHLAYSEKRMADAESAAPIRPTVVPAIVGDAVESVERAEELGGPDIVEESTPLRQSMVEKVVQLAATPGMDADGRAKLMMFSVRLTGSGDHSDALHVSKRKERLSEPLPPDDADADDQEPVDEADGDPGPPDEADEPAAAPAPVTTPKPEPEPEPDDGDSEAADEDEPAAGGGILEDDEPPAEEPPGEDRTDEDEDAESDGAGDAGPDGSGDEGSDGSGDEGSDGSGDGDGDKAGGDGEDGDDGDDGDDAGDDDAGGHDLPAEAPQPQL